MTKNIDQQSWQPVERLRYDQALAELEKIIQDLEVEELSLEDALALFERGQLLVGRCNALLEQAEVKVQSLSGGQVADLELPE